MSNFFISDLHFGAEDIFFRTERDKTYGTVEQMGETFISEINDTTKPGDILYILGDVGCADHDPTEELERIKAKKILIAGNHDQRWLHHRHFCRQFEAIMEIGAIRECGTRIVLCHYPLAEWDGFMKGHWHFYGHVHDMKSPGGQIMKGVPRSCNVGVDVIGARPKTAAELILGNFVYRCGGDIEMAKEAAEKNGLKL